MIFQMIKIILLRLAFALFGLVLVFGCSSAKPARSSPIPAHSNTHGDPIALRIKNTPCAQAHSNSATLPAFLQLHDCSEARVDVSPWPGSSYGAVVGRLADLVAYQDINASLREPSSALHVPVGTVVIIRQTVWHDSVTRIVAVSAKDRTFSGFTMLGRLVPVAPASTMFTIASDDNANGEPLFDGPNGSAKAHLPSFTKVSTDGSWAVRNVDANSTNWVLAHIRVQSGGEHAGKTGWVRGVSLGFPTTASDRFAPCRCYINTFE